jgi:hypothetical protein
MLTIDVEKRMSFKEFFEIPMFQTHEVRRQTPTVTGEATMGQSLVALELSESYDCEEYELTLINECTMQPKFLKRETIDF